MRTLKALLAIIIVLLSAALLKQEVVYRFSQVDRYSYTVNDASAPSEVQTIEYVLTNPAQGWAVRLNEVYFDEPVMVIGVSLIACVSATQGIEARLSRGDHDLSVDTFSDDTLFHLSSVYSEAGGLATATVMLPHGFYYHVDAGERLAVDFFANTPGDGGSLLIYYVRFTS